MTSTTTDEYDPAGSDSLATESVLETSRRGFMGITATGLGAAGALVGAGLSMPAHANGAGSTDDILSGTARAAEAAGLKLTAARRQLNQSQSLPSQKTNRDERRYSGDNFYSSFAKCLPQNEFGEVDADSYQAYKFALEHGDEQRMGALALDSTADRKLANPLGAFRFELQGLDGWATRTPPAPTFRSATTAAEMVELYWLAHTRDVPFASYSSDSMVGDALADINGLSAPVGPTAAGVVTAETLFRGATPGDLAGPYLSQFLAKQVPYGPSTIDQRYTAPVAGSDFMTDQANWLNVQRGGAPLESPLMASSPTYIFNNRTLAEYVHQDVVWQAYFNAGLMLLGLGGDALDESNPYLGNANQGAFTSFGGPFLLHLLTYAGNLSLQGAWYHKWLVHRRLRPESFGGRIHHQMESGKSYEIHSDVLNSAGAALAASNTGGYFLSQAYAEGSPTHPAYPAGHATIAGSCCTILKAFFNEQHVLPDPVVSDSVGSSLQPWVGGDLTVGNEINKLAANISLGRDAAGVHFRSDGIDGLAIGEQQGLQLLADHSQASREDFAGFTLTTFDGTRVQIRNGRVRAA